MIEDDIANAERELAQRPTQFPPGFKVSPDDALRVLEDQKTYAYEQKVYETIVARKMAQISSSQEMEPGHHTLADLRDAHANIVQALQHLNSVAHNLLGGVVSETIALNNKEELDPEEACWQATEAMAKMNWRREELHPMNARAEQYG